MVSRCVSLYPMAERSPGQTILRNRYANGRMQWLPPVDSEEMKSYRAAQRKCDGLGRYWCNRDAEDRRSIEALLLSLQRKCTDSANRSNAELTRWLLMFGAVMRPPDNVMRLLKVSRVACIPCAAPQEPRCRMHLLTFVLRTTLPTPHTLQGTTHTPTPPILLPRPCEFEL